MMAKDRESKYQESYVAAEAFSGSYELRVRSAWGRPMGGKVTLRVTRHQGTPDQAQELHRLELASDGTAYLKVHLEGGRRTEAASVPPPVARRPERAAAAGTAPDRVYNLLRAMAEPAYSGMTKQGMVGGTSASGPMAAQVANTASDIGMEVVHQNRLATANCLQTGTELVGQAVFSAERREIKMSLAPVFQTASDAPEVKLSLIPGGN
jgi:hypothetical protein